MERVFIIGIGRSGSTLLSQCLGNHPDLLETPEVPLFSFFYTWRNNHQWNKIWMKEVKEYMRRIQAKHTGHPWIFRTDELLIISESISYYEAMNQLSLLFQKKNAHATAQPLKIQWVVDKNPVHTFFVSAYLKRFPKAKAIFLVRDPRDNLASRMQSENLRNGRKNDWQIDILRWKRYQLMGEKLLQKHPEQIQLLRYEDLVNYPEEELRSLFSFLGVSTDKDFLIKGAHANESHSNGRLFKKYEDLMKPINTVSVGKWKRVLTKIQADTLEKTCANEMRLFGYSPSLNLPQGRLTLKSTLIEWWYWKKEMLIYRLPPGIKINRIG